MLTRYLKSFWEQPMLPDNFYGIKMNVGQYLDLSYAEMTGLMDFYQGRRKNYYKEHDGNAFGISVSNTTLSALRLRDSYKTITSIMGKPFVRKAFRDGQKNSTTLLLYKNHAVEEMYPCIVFLGLTHNKLNYAAFDFPGSNNTAGHIDPRLLALFDTFSLFNLLDKENLIVQHAALDIFSREDHLIIDHGYRLKVRLMEAIGCFRNKLKCNIE